MYKTILKIDGMMCSMCEAHMNDLIRQNCQIKKVESSAKKGETVVISQEELNIELLKGKIQDIGYKLIEAKGERYDKNADHLPIYGVGPFYGIGIIALTIVGIALSCLGQLEFGRIPEMKVPFLVVGILLCIAGFVVWFKGAFRIDKYIENNELCTDGIYGIVRNPCYSGIMLMCDGALLITGNLALLVLPLLYWLTMTVLMKMTEKKWLYQIYGDKYLEYCKRVNRCIPWLSKKR